MSNETMQQIIEKYPWIKEENQKLIISPDSDGFFVRASFHEFF